MDPKILENLREYRIEFGENNKAFNIILKYKIILYLNSSELPIWCISLSTAR